MPVDYIERFHVVRFVSNVYLQFSQELFYFETGSKKIYYRGYS